MESREKLLLPNLPYPVAIDYINIIDVNLLLRRRQLIYMDDQGTQTMQSMIAPAVKSLIRPLDMPRIWRNVWALDEELAGD